MKRLLLFLLICSTGYGQWTGQPDLSLSIDSIAVTSTAHGDSWVSPLEISALTGYHTITLDGNITLTFADFAASGKASSMTIRFLQDATGSRTVTWPAAVLVAPLINPTANSITFVSMLTSDGGTTVIAGSDYGGDILQAVAAGTVYTLTTSYAAVDFGTTDPAITIPDAGTYLVSVTIQTSLVAATTTTQSCSFKLRRTNNTPADIAGGEFGQPLPVATVGTALGPTVCISAIKYTTTNTDDAITVQGILSGALGAGTVTCTNATITAVRLY